MPRTLPANLQNAIDANAEPYFKVYTSDVGDSPALLTDAKVMEFEIHPLTLRAKFYCPTQPDPLGLVQIERGRIYNTVEIGVKTSTFHIREAKRNDYQGIYEVSADIAPPEQISTAGDVTYETVINAFCTAIGKTAVYEDTAAAWLDYQFLPDGRTMTISTAMRFFTMLKQKYLIFATDYGDNKIFFAQYRTKTRSWTVEDPRISYNEVTTVRRLMWRDEANTVHYNTADPEPLHNLGYLESTDSAPGRSYFSRFYSPVRHAPELKYLTTDFTLIGNPTAKVDVMLEVVESFNPAQTPAWNITLQGMDIFGNTEGGTLPSTIEAAAPYTPLNTSNFNNNLDTTVNNLQALADRVDELSGGRWLPFGIYTHFNPLTADLQQPYSTSVDRTVTFVSWHQEIYVQTTNNASNYWKVQLNRGRDGAVIAEFNTSSPSVIAVNTIVHFSTTTFSIASVGTGDQSIYMYVRKVGNPGNLYIFGPMVEVTV